VKIWSWDLRSTSCLGIAACCSATGVRSLSHNDPALVASPSLLSVLAERKQLHVPWHFQPVRFTYSATGQWNDMIHRQSGLFGLPVNLLNGSDVFSSEPARQGVELSSAALGKNRSGQFGAKTPTLAVICQPFFAMLKVMAREDRRAFLGVVLPPFVLFSVVGVGLIVSAPVLGGTNSVWMFTEVACGIFLLALQALGTPQGPSSSAVLRARLSVVGCKPAGNRVGTGQSYFERPRHSR